VFAMSPSLSGGIRRRQFCVSRTEARLGRE
jgi:hypothetical protein